MARDIEIVPSVLPADFSRLGAEVAALEEAGVDRIQWDVMDGVFVPNLTVGPDVIAACRPHATVPFEAHLMVVDPELLMHRYVEAGCELLIIHAESTRHLHRTLAQVADLGARAAVALSPATPVAAVRSVLDLVEMVLVMTVNPGFGGQGYLASMEPKVAEVRAIVDAEGMDVDIEVDGGIAPAPWPAPRRRAPTSWWPAQRCTGTRRASPTPSPTSGPAPPLPPPEPVPVAGWRSTAAVTPARSTTPATSTRRHSALTRRSCSTVRTGADSRAGLPTTATSASARERATLRREVLSRKSRPRGTSAADEAVSE
jgi:ribulose-phosphate 3-epimerase